MSSHHPYYRRARPSQKNENDFTGDHSRIDFCHAHLDAFDHADAVVKASAQLDDRVAAVVRAFAGPEDRAFWELPHDQSTLVERDLLESHPYPGTLFEWDGAHAFIPTTKCLAILAYPDFFSTWGSFSLHANPPEVVAQAIVSEVILEANPGWCGTFGPFISFSSWDPIGSAAEFAAYSGEGNYDMAQMHLLPMAYRYYDRLTPDAREHLITSLLAGGTVHGPGNDDSHTCGFFLGTWSRAGMVSPLGYKKSIGETENHILMIMTARYLTNQLLYQRDPKLWFDNRRNSIDEILASVVSEQRPPFNFLSPIAPHKEPSPGSCAFLLLDLLQRILRDDFSEYNAKGYQQETRWALVNLHSYAYDHEIRLAAKMVLDYLSARFVTSTNDLRRLVPFRRRNEAPKNARDPQGYMTVDILDAQDGGGDPMAPIFAILAGNLRAYEVPYAPASWSWGIPADKDGGDEVIDALGDYRIPPSIHDLFVNDLHRRFYQRLHRFVRSDEDDVGGHRNCDNMEIYAGSPSYLITAGGTAGPFAIDPFFLGVPVGPYNQQRGVAVTTNFMPTTYSHNSQKSTRADQLIQFSCFADVTNGRIFDNWYGAWNYGVAPDFACGHQIHLPQWLTDLKDTADYVADGNFTFVRQVPLSFASLAPQGRPGFYLVLFQENGFALLEAFDSWLNPGVTFAQFQEDVRRRNRKLTLQNNVKTHYKTWNGNEFDFVIWNDASRHEALVGAEVLNFVYGTRDPRDSFGNAGNVTDKFLNGTVLNSTNDAVVEITNHDLGTKITLDMHDLLHPRRVSETGEVEQAGFDNEIYLDFEWKGPNEGDAFQPFSVLADATAAVADGGVIKILPGQTRDRSTITAGGKRMKLVAPIGEVGIGVR
jgi:hypothetical protein